MDSIVTLVGKAGYIYRRLPDYIQDELKADHKSVKGLLDEDVEVYRIGDYLRSFPETEDARRKGPSS